MKYTISILTAFSLELAKKCIASVLANSPMNVTRLLLTANGNVDAFEYFSKLEDEHENVAVIYNAENKGFIEPNKAALQSTDTEFFVMLNDDCEVPRGWLEAMEKPFDEFPTCAISGPTGGRYKHSPPPSDAVHFIEGSCMMGMTALLKEVGLFSDYLEFAYWEEADLEFRLMAMGYTLHKTPFDIKHVVSATSKKIPGMEAIKIKNLTEVKKRFPQYFPR